MKSLRGPHDWFLPRRFAYPICRICGIVQRRDGKNKPCKGPTRLRPMEGEDCGYQDVACWERQLRAAGWRPWNIRTGKESRGSTTWKSPHGLFYRGPYGAWKVMRDAHTEDR